MPQVGERNHPLSDAGLTKTRESLRRRPRPMGQSSVPAQANTNLDRGVTTPAPRRMHPADARGRAHHEDQRPGCPWEKEFA